MYHEFTTKGTLRSDDGDGNENVKKLYYLACDMTKVEPHGFAAIWNLEKKIIIIKPLALRINTTELSYDPTTATPMKTYTQNKGK